MLLVALAALGGGCVGRYDRGREAVYRHEPMAVAGLIAAGAVLPALCWKAHRRAPDSRLIARCLLAGMVLPPIFALGFAPSWIRDRVRVDDDGFEAVGGSLLEERDQAVRFDQLARIQLQTEEVVEQRRRGGRRTVRKQALLFIRKDGTSEKFYPDTLINAAAPDIVARAAARGVPVVDADEQARHAREADTRKAAEIVLRQLRDAGSPRSPAAPVANRTPTPAPTPGAADATGRVARIMARVLGLEPNAVRPEKTLAQLGVGYPDFAGLATELEDEFGVVLDVDELEKAAGARGWDELARKLTVAALAKSLAASHVGPGEGRGRERRPTGD